MLLTESGRSAVLAEADGSASQLWRVSALGAGYTVTSASGLALDVSGADASEGNAVWLYEPNGTPAQKWLLADPAIPRAVDDGPYRLASSLDGSMAVAASASGCSLSPGAGALNLDCNRKKPHSTIEFKVPAEVTDAFFERTEPELNELPMAA